MGGWRPSALPRGTGYPCRCGARGGACLFGRLLPLPLACFSAPLPRRRRISPRPPSPTGKGGTKGYFMQGASPLASPGLNPRGTCYSCPGGEDHLKRRSSSPPVPLSLAAGTVHQCRVPAATPPVGTVNARRAGNAGGKPPAGYSSGRSSQCRPGSAPGMQGAEPLA